MKTQESSHTPILVLKLLERTALASAYVGANSSCSYVYHDPKKPETLKALKKF